MLARFQQAGGSVQWTERTDKACAATFAHPQGGKCDIRWTLDDAKRAGLLSGKSNWNQYPRQMLSARVVSEGVRAVFPGVLGGFYTPEEVSQFEPVAAAPLAYARPEPQTPVLTDAPEVVEAEFEEVKPEPVRVAKAEPVRKKQPAAQSMDGADMTEATLIEVQEKHGEGKKGPWTCWKATLEINGRKLYPSTFEADLGDVLNSCEPGDTLMVKLAERPYTDRNGETKKGYDLVFATKANVPAKAEDKAQELAEDDIPF
jgi:hypothetical protein